MAADWREEVSLPRLSDFVLELAGARAGSTRDSLVVTDLALDLPVEIDAWRVDDARMHLGLSTPTQIVATTVMPVLHRLVLHVVAVEEEPDDG